MCVVDDLSYTQLIVTSSSGAPNFARWPILQTEFEIIIFYIGIYGLQRMIVGASNGKLIRELIDLGSNVSGHRVNGSDKAEIKKNISKIISDARSRRKKSILR